jgi:hypothetical protein
MKKFCLVLLLLTGCNSVRCEFTHPDNMSENLLKYCAAENSKSKEVVYVNQKF